MLITLNACLHDVYSRYIFSLLMSMSSEVDLCGMALVLLFTFWITICCNLLCMVGVNISVIGDMGIHCHFSTSAFGHTQSNWAADLPLHQQFYCAVLSQAATAMDLLQSRAKHPPCLQVGCGDKHPSLPKIHTELTFVQKTWEKATFKSQHTQLYFYDF